MKASRINDFLQGVLHLNICGETQFMPFRKTFVVSDETVNDYGFWVRTAGISLDTAKKNCPAYYNHRTWDIPLGHWENLRLDNNRLLADIVIDGSNELEDDYIRKIENGDIKGASIGADPIEWKHEAAYLKSGQTMPTLWTSNLFEISLAPLPGNKNALALKSKDGLVTLSDDNRRNLIPDLNTEPDMKQIALKLGLPENAPEAEILAALTKVQLNAANAEVMRKHIEDTADANLKDEPSKKLFVELSKTNINAALDFLKLSMKTDGNGDATPSAAGETKKIEKNVKVSELIKKVSVTLIKEEGENNCFDYLQKHNPVELRRIHTEEPEKYAELAKDYQAGVRYKGK